MLLAITSVFVASGIYPPAAPSPFGHALLWAYGHVPGAAGLRTTYKATAEVCLAVAILMAFGLDALWERLSRVRPSLVFKGLALAAISSLVWLNAAPLVQGRMYDPSHGLGTIPGYWKQAFSALDRRDIGYRAVFIPSTGWGVYRWGAIKEGVVEADQTLTAVDPARFPVGQRYGSNLLAAIEQPYLNGLPAAGTSTLLRYLGIRDVVLQNDLDWRRSNTARPASLQRLLGDPGLEPAAH